jgi:hypothetical protein
MSRRQGPSPLKLRKLNHHMGGNNKRSSKYQGLLKTSMVAARNFPLVDRVRHDHFVVFGRDYRLHELETALSPLSLPVCDETLNRRRVRAGH